MWDGSQNGLDGSLDSFIVGHGLPRKVIAGLPCLDVSDNPDLMKRLMRVGGVYLLYCRATGKRDVGMCACFNKRRSKHFSQPTNKMLEDDIREHGRGAFEFHIVEPLDLKGIAKEEWGTILLKRETYWVKRSWELPGGKDSSYNMVLPCLYRYPSKGEIFPPMAVVMAAAQKAGIKDSRAYRKWAKECGFPSAPYDTYAGEWVGWKHFLCTLGCALPKKTFPPMEVVMDAAKKAGVKGSRAYRKWARKLGLPTRPDAAYKDKSLGWNHFLGTEVPAFDVVMAAAQKAGINDSRAYRKWARKLGLPSNPNETYKGAWMGWNHFLSVGFPAFEIVMGAAQKAGIKGVADYRKWARTMGFPSEPRNTYKDKWTGWKRFLGTGFPAFEIVMEATRKAGIKTGGAYRKWAREMGFPSDPHDAYKDKWLDWYHFLGKENPTAAGQHA